MSRIGLKHITLPAGVSVEIAGEVATVKGPKGSLQVRVPSVIKVEGRIYSSKEKKQIV